MHGMGAHDGHHAEPKPAPDPLLDSRDEMVHDMSTGMWADDNAGGFAWGKLVKLTGPPFWSAMFSRFKTKLQAGEGYRMASPDLKGGPGFLKRVWSTPLGRYVTEQVELAPRQGDFDNIHMAPPMRAPPSIRYLYPQKELRLDEIVMAPFCIHDCLHLHWRWLPTGENETWMWGWDETGPYAVAGVPHIPVNQHLRVEMESTHAFVYSVHADTAMPAGQWQYVLHEGLAYGLNANPQWLARLMQTGTALLERWPPAAALSWAMFYWALRYRDDSGKAAELLLEDCAPGP
ncbi:hypothetical protein D7X74_38030 [Corallococcus sp. CA047B]|nr:hypothetical protein D7X74_38030 [Corallococcus sp. CA047B]